MNKKKKLFAILSRGKYCDEDVVFLRSCLLGDNKVLRSSAAHLVGSFKIKECLEDLVNLLSDNFGTVYSLAVAQFGKISIEIVQKKLNSKTTDIFRANSASILGFYPSTSSLKTLAVLLSDKCILVRRMAAGHLKYMHCCRKEAIDVIETRLKIEKNKNVRLFLIKSRNELKV